VFIALTVAGVAHSQRLDAVEDADTAGDNIFQFSYTALYQYAARAAEDTGNHELDLFGSLKVVERHARPIGNGRVVLWARARANLGSLQPASEMAAAAGLLWPTNDVVVTNSTVSVPLLSWAQFFAGDRLRVWTGKIWPQLFFVQQKLAGENPKGFMSRLISNDMAARYYDLAGLGVFAEYSGRKFFAKGSFIDAQAETEIDISSFAEGRWAWVAEAGLRSRRSHGTTSLSALVSTVSRTDDVEGETAYSVAFSHDLARSVHTIFGRYTYRRGGAPLTEKGIVLAKPLDRSAFVAWAWNRPFDSDRQQLAAAFVYGEPIDFTDVLGFNIQYGLEIFWKVRIGDNLEITPDLQILQDRDGTLEVVPGFRLRAFTDFVF
jgi:hypothetical protein